MIFTKSGILRPIVVPRYDALGIHHKERTEDRPNQSREVPGTYGSALAFTNNRQHYATGTEKCSCAMRSLPEASRCMTCVARTVSSFSAMRLPPTSRPLA
jgi:hypothetical protein